MRLQLERQGAQLRRGEVGAKAFGSQLLLAADIERVQVVPGAKDESVDDEREVPDRREPAKPMVQHSPLRRSSAEHDPRNAGCGQVERDDERNRTEEVYRRSRAPQLPLDRA